MAGRNVIDERVFELHPEYGRVRVTLLMAVLVVAISIGVFAVLPPRRLDLAPGATPADSPVVAGVFHVHSSRSDGIGTPDEIAAAAARAGLRFVVLTDHGDGTRQPDPPQYRSSVLCLDAVEISTADGHYIAVGMPQAPYPLAGEGRDVVEDVRRLGGFGVVAHPDSAKSELRWRDWSASFDAIEWLNADSEWRDETSGRLAQALLTYPFRPVETLTSLLDRPATTLERWDALTQRRPVIGLPGADAHAKVAWRDDAAAPYRSRVFVPFPRYESSFDSFSLRVELERPFTGDAAADAAMLMTALRQGRLFTAVDGLATPPYLELVARSGRHSARQGEALELDGPVVLDIRSDAPEGSSIVLFRNGRILAKGGARTFRQELPPESTVLRAEVWLSATDDPPLPWIVSNPIYVSRPPQLPVGRRIAAEERALAESTAGADWQIEQRPGSSVTLEKSADRLSLRYSLGREAPAAQFVAVGISAPALLRQFDRVSFRGVADRPMRLFVQLRRPADSEGQRWRRSVYLDREPRDVTTFFDEMTPIGRTTTFRPDLNTVTDLLFVIDTTNNIPGQSGTFAIDALRLGR